jgi:two-component sensor histidine kinase
VIVSEWVTNAYKYAYPGSAGQVRVSLKREGPAALRLTVADDGVGLDDQAKPKGTGLGTRIVASMAKDLGVTVERRLRERGAEFSIAFKEDGLPSVSALGDTGPQRARTEQAA